MFPPLKTSYKGIPWGQKASPLPMPPALICKQPLTLCSGSSSDASRRATASGGAHCLQSWAAASPHKSRIPDVTPGLQRRAAESSWSPSGLCFPQEFVISNLRGKQLNKPIIFSEMPAKAYPRARRGLLGSPGLLYSHLPVSRAASFGNRAEAPWSIWYPATTDVFTLRVYTLVLPCLPISTAPSGGLFVTYSNPFLLMPSASPPSLLATWLSAKYQEDFTKKTDRQGHCSIDICRSSFHIQK